MSDKASSKRRSQTSAQLAKRALDLSSGVEREPSSEAQVKDPAAVELGRKGGLKGGKARAEALSADRRQEIARAAAAERWKKQQRD